MDEAMLVSRAGWSLYHGRELRGAIETVLLRGRAVFANGEVVGLPGQDRWIRPRDAKAIPEGEPVATTG